jgi:hypothetical protein
MKKNNNKNINIPEYSQNLSSDKVAGLMIVPADVIEIPPLRPTFNKI